MEIPVIENGCVVLVGTNGIWIDNSYQNLTQDFKVGPTTYTGGPSGILPVVGDVLSIIVRNEPLTDQERQKVIQAGVKRGSAGGLIPAYTLLELWYPPTDTQAHLWRHYYAAGNVYEMWAPSDDLGHYTCARFSEYSGSAFTIGRLYEGMVGITKHHSSEEVTKTGTWASSSDARAFGGNAARSATAGDTIKCTVHGSTLGLRVVVITNGGYGTVAIDGDYTAAKSLPAVTQELIDAGKFTQDQLGHRYINCYGSVNSLDYWDMHVLLAEGLPSADYEITVRVSGSAASGTGNRVYISAFVGADSGYIIGDAGVEMFYVRTLQRSGSESVSAMTNAWVLNPTGEASEDTGDNHGNETITSLDFLVDGSPVSLNAGEAASGDLIEIARSLEIEHPVLGVVGTKDDKFSCRGDRRYQVQYEFETELLFDGTLGFAYCGMLNHQTSNLPLPDDFRAAVIGSTEVRDFESSSGQSGFSKDTVMAFLDPVHPTLFSVSVFDPEETLDGWSYAGNEGSSGHAYISDVSNNRKLYFTRALGSGSSYEPVTIGKKITGSYGWRAFRLLNGYSLLKEVIG